MSRCTETALVLAAALAAASPARALDDFGLGRAATSDEVKAWDIDVRPDFAGLPKGSGSVSDGEAVWESKCAVCHGVFGESNNVFPPLIGGVTKEDVKTGHVAALTQPDYPGRTTFMKVATIATLFDYIRRAMPWDAPKSLTNNQVYAVLAYMLSLSEIVPDNFVLNDATIRDVQKIMPNRNGMTVEHAMWPSASLSGKEIKPDVDAMRCMKDCKSRVEISSTLPDHVLSLYGNIADQNRRIGPARGQATDAAAPGGGAGGIQRAPRRRQRARRAQQGLNCAGPRRSSRGRGSGRKENRRRRWGSRNMAMSPRRCTQGSDIKALLASTRSGAPSEKMSNDKPIWRAYSC